MRVSEIGCSAKAKTRGCIRLMYSKPITTIRNGILIEIQFEGAVDLSHHCLEMTQSMQMMSCTVITEIPYIVLWPIAAAQKQLHVISINRSSSTSGGPGR